MSKVLEKYETIKDQKDLDAFISEYDNYNPEVSYISQNVSSGECYAIVGCTHASEAFDFVGDQCRLVVSGCDLHHKQVDEQLNSEYPDMSPFYLGA